MALINSLHVCTFSFVPEIKDEFYENLPVNICSIPSKEHLILLGDFNVRVGTDSEFDLMLLATGFLER